MGFSKQNLQSLVQVAVDNGASDVHIRMGEAPAFRIRGELIPVQTKAFAQDDILDLLGILLNENLTAEHIEKLAETDGSYEIENLCRLRFNSFRFSGKTGIVLRIVSMKIPSIAELGLPPVIKSIANRRRGLVMVTGATGSGKSTTLASMKRVAAILLRLKILLNIFILKKNRRLAKEKLVETRWTLTPL